MKITYRPGLFLVLGPGVLVLDLRSLSLGLGPGLGTYANDTRSRNQRQKAPVSGAGFWSVCLWHYCLAAITGNDKQPAMGAKRIQALADISRSALYAFAVYKAIRLHSCVLS